MTLDDLLRDLASRGEISHISLTPRGKGWAASFAPCSVFGFSFFEHADPAEAIKGAIAGAKIRKRAPFKNSKLVEHNTAAEKELIVNSLLEDPPKDPWD